MFKEMFALDNRPTDITLNDIQRRNAIASLLAGWGLLDIVEPENHTDIAPLSQIKVVKFSEKKDWTLVSKYSIGQFN